MSGFNPLPDPDDWMDGKLSDEESEERFDRAWNEAREQFDPDDWVNGRIDRESLDHRDRATLVEWFKEKVVDNDFQFPQALTDFQLAWPHDCPLSEEELRREVEELGAQMKALRRRAQELRDLLPEGPCHGEMYESLPPSIYFELTDGIDSVLDPMLAFTEQRIAEILTETPQNLAFKWLSTDPPESVKARVQAELKRRRPREEP